MSQFPPEMQEKVKSMSKDEVIFSAQHILILTQGVN